MPVAILFFSIWIMIDEFKNYNLFSKLENDPSLLIPIFASLFSTFSVLFGLSKLIEIIESNSTFYKFLRIGDLIFAIGFFTLMMTGVFFIIDNPETRTSNSYFIGLSIVVILTIFSMILFYDNLKYHKKQKVLFTKDDIDEIGV